MLPACGTENSLSNINTSSDLTPDSFYSPPDFLRYQPDNLAPRQLQAQKYFVYFHEVEPVFGSEHIRNLSSVPVNIVGDGDFGIALAVSFSTPKLNQPNHNHNSYHLVWCGFNIVEISPPQPTPVPTSRPLLSLNLIQFQTCGFKNAASMNQHLGFIDYQTLLFRTLQNLGLAMRQAGAIDLHYISVQNSWKYDCQKARDKNGYFGDLDIDEQVRLIQTRRQEWAQQMGCYQPTIVGRYSWELCSALSKPLEDPLQPPIDPMVSLLTHQLKNTS